MKTEERGFSDKSNKDVIVKPSHPAYQKLIYNDAGLLGHKVPRKMTFPLWDISYLKSIFLHKKESLKSR